MTSLATRMANRIEESLNQLNGISNKNYPIVFKESYNLKGQKDYAKTIQTVLSNQTKAISDMLPKKEWEEKLQNRYTFFDTIQPEMNKILNNHASDVESHIQGFYDAGKNKGYKIMDVKAFFGESDKQALFNLQNYNFDLIRGASNDLISGVRSEIWTGIARGDDTRTIAKAIEKLPLEPIKAGNAVLTPENRAVLIARTESMRAYNQGSLLSYQQAGVEMVEIDATGTEGEFNCDCEDIVNDSPYRIDDPELPELPRHPNCTHSYAPLIDAPVDGLMDVDTYIDLVLSGEQEVNPIL